MFSWIQYHILLELTRHKTRRYSQLRPQDVEGNLFMYHLNGLLKEGLVEKYERAYRLSIKGLQFAGTLSLNSGKTRVQPKILTAIVCKNDVGDYLFSRWHRQPNTDLISFPHGMMHYGEHLWDMARRELAEKAALMAEFEHLGEVYVRGMRGDEVDRHMLVHLFKAVTIQSAPLQEQRRDISEPFWAPLATLHASDFVPGFYEIAKLVEDHPNGPIFADYVVDIQ